MEYSKLFKKYAKIDLDAINEEALRKEAQKMGINIERGEGKAVIADKIYKKCCLPEISNPVFLIHHPKGSAPLAKECEKEPEKLARFQLVIAGWEIVNAFSELNDPLEQRKRFELQEKILKAGHEEAMKMDEDFIEALEYGMPPSAGFGMGIDRLTALLTNSHSLRDIILFPAMRQKKD